MSVASRFISLALAYILVLVNLSPALAVTQHGKRHLVYSFNIGVNDNTDISKSAAPIDFDMDACKGQRTPSGVPLCGALANQNIEQHGVSSYADAASDKGQISIDVAGVQPDGALVVTVTETADRRSNAATDCLIYQDTTVKCAGAVTPEEFAVMRTLSPKFLDPAFSDEGRHWLVEHGTQNVPSEFTVESKTSSSVTVDEQRAIKMAGANRGTISTEAKYTYDETRLLPTSISEYTFLHYERDAGHTRNATVDITAHLIEDSAVGKN
jgi:hypothetical protein